MLSFNKAKTWALKTYWVSVPDAECKHSCFLMNDTEGKRKKIINAMQMNERLHEGQGVENNKNQRESSRVVEQSPVD